MKSLKLTSATAISYVTLGALGLAFAIPPGYASPLFPAAGLAVALVLYFGHAALPGIWLGSLLLNLAVARQNGQLSETTSTIAVILGAGAALQAGVARALILVWVGEKWRFLETESDIARFLVTAGPVACLLSATIGVSTLLFTGMVPRANFAFSWWNWWIGDTFGVLIFAPLALIFLLRRDQSWTGRLTVVAGSMLVALCLVGIALQIVTRWEKKQQMLALEAHGGEIASLLNHRFVAHQEAFSALGRLIEVTPQMTYGQFDNFTRITLRDNPDIFAMSYNPYIRDASRSEYERFMSKVFRRPGFTMTERDGTGKIVPSAEHPAYVPVGFIAPLEPSKAALGYDIYSDAVRRAAIEKARYSGKPAVTAPIQLVQVQRKMPGVLVLHPLYSTDVTRAPERFTRLAGFVVGVLKIEEMIQIATAGKLPAGLVLQVKDPKADERMLFQSDGGRNLPIAPYLWQTTLTIADREWSLALFPTAEYLQKHRSWVAWGVGFVGLLFAALLQVLMLAMTGRTAVVQRTVTEQTLELMKAKEKADAASHAKSRFLAMMSHEIRTPMNALMGLAQLLEHEPLQPNQRAIVKRISSSGQMLMGILNDVLDFSKIESGQLSIEKRPFGLTAVLAKIHGMMSPVADGKGLTLVLGEPKLEQRLLGDSLRLEQVIVNLVGNAIKFTNAGSVRIQVHAFDRCTTAVRLRFEITDTGIGISPENAKKLFIPFTQADSSISRRFGGTGLGLSICKRLIEMMGGEIGVDSQEGSGSTFWFEIRLELATADHAAKHPVDKPDAEARLDGLRVLVVDDNEINLFVAEEMLKRQGARTTLALNGKEAVQRLQERPRAFDAVLMDIQMPVMDGLAAASIIRKELGLSQLPIIAFTAGVQNNEREDAFAAGISDFLSKPVQMAQMTAVLKRWAGQHPPVAEDIACAVSLNEPPPDSGTPGSGISGIDAEWVRCSLGNDFDFALRMVRQFAEKYGDGAQRIQSDLAQGKTEAAARLIHAMKGTAGNIGALAVMHACETLEEAIHRDPAELPPLLGKLDAHLATLVGAASTNEAILNGVRSASGHH